MLDAIFTRHRIPRPDAAIADATMIWIGI